MNEDQTNKRITPFIHRKPSSLRYFQEGAAPISLDSWELEIFGEVKTPLKLNLTEIKSFPADYHHRRTVCVCLWTIKRHWFGVLLRDILEAAGVDLEDDQLYLKQLSNGTEKGKYDSTIHMRSAIERNAILAYEVDDEPLSIENGFPLRLIDFGLYNYKCVKALKSIEVTRKNEIGFWEDYAGYSLDGTIQPKKYFAVDLQKKVWFSGTGEVRDSDI